MTGKARMLVAAAALAAPLFAASAAVGYVVGPCNGSVTINGIAYGPANDTPANPIVVPREGTATWEGSTRFPIHDHTGAVGIVVGPATISVATWAGENADDETQASGVYQLEDAFDRLPVDVVGLYRVRGFHRGAEGQCEGEVVVRIEGNPLATVPGAASVGLTALALGGVAGAAFARRPGP